MPLTQDEMIEALQLTQIQKKAFQKLEKAYDQCLKAGIVFVGFDEFQHAINGTRLVGHDSNLSRDIQENEVNLNDVDAPRLIIQEPYVSCAVLLEVSE